VTLIKNGGDMRRHERLLGDEYEHEHSTMEMRLRRDGGD